ncbi:MAG: hypothetical protein ACI3Z9_05560 [Candidatus Onthomorpha sp.]
MLEKKRRFLTKKTPIFSKKTKIFWKKTAFFCVKMNDLKNQSLTKAIFLLENALNKSPFWQNKSAFCPTETAIYFCETAFCKSLV